VCTGNWNFKGERQKPITATVLSAAVIRKKLLPFALDFFLFPEAKTFNYISVSFNVAFFDIVKKSSSLANQLQQTPSGMMIFLMRFKMIS
jgi:hypothetical protein